MADLEPVAAPWSSTWVIGRLLTFISQFIQLLLSILIYLSVLYITSEILLQITLPNFLTYDAKAFLCIFLSGLFSFSIFEISYRFVRRLKNWIARKDGQVLDSSPLAAKKWKKDRKNLERAFRVVTVTTFPVVAAFIGELKRINEFLPLMASGMLSVIFWGLVFGINEDGGVVDSLTAVLLAEYAQEGISQALKMVIISSIPASLIFLYPLLKTIKKLCKGTNSSQPADRFSRKDVFGKWPLINWLRGLMILITLVIFLFTVIEHSLAKDLVLKLIHHFELKEAPDLCVRPPTDSHS